jgi:uncharacterized protein YbaA (DUF1428 family)
MSFIDGFVLAVPTGNKAAFEALAGRAAEVFIEHGALRVIECWGEDVPEGEKTDFHRAVQAQPGETIVFSWVEWPSRAARDAGNDKIAVDPRMQPAADETPPFDGARMIYGGFTPILDVRAQ